MLDYSQNANGDTVDESCGEVACEVRGKRRMGAASLVAWSGACVSLISAPFWTSLVIVAAGDDRAFVSTEKYVGVSLLLIAMQVLYVGYVVHKCRQAWYEETARATILRSTGLLLVPVTLVALFGVANDWPNPQVGAGIGLCACAIALTILAATLRTRYTAIAVAGGAVLMIIVMVIERSFAPLGSTYLTAVVTWSALSLGARTTKNELTASTSR